MHMLVEPELDGQALELFLTSLRETPRSAHAIQSWWQEHKGEYNAIVKPFSQFGETQAQIDVLWEMRNIVPDIDSILASCWTQKGELVSLPLHYTWIEHMHAVQFDKEKQLHRVRQNQNQQQRRYVTCVSAVWEGLAESKQLEMSILRHRHNQVSIPVRIAEFVYDTGQKMARKRIVSVKAIVSALSTCQHDGYWYSIVKSRHDLKASRSFDDVPNVYAQECLVPSPYAQAQDENVLYLKLEEYDLESLANHAIVQWHWTKFVRNTR
jgi:hypothetical protein